MDELRRQSQEDVYESLRKELKVTRICCLIVAVLLVCVIAGGIYIANMMSPMVLAMQEIQPAIVKMEQIDVGVLNEKIAQLDIEGMNKMIQGIDTEEVMEALENVNEVMEKIEELQEGFESFSDSLSNSFGSWFGLGKGNSL